MNTCMCVQGGGGGGGGGGAMYCMKQCLTPDRQLCFLIQCES